MNKVTPTGWSVATLGELSTVITKGTTPTTNGYPYTESGVKFLRVENISKGGKILEDDLKYISNEANGSLSRSQLHAGDLLISIAGAIGRSAIVEKKHLPANTNQAVGIVRLNKNQVENNYIRFSFESPIVDKQIKDLQSGLAQINLNLEQLGSLRINLPPRSEQKKIVAILTAVDDVIDCTQRQINNLKNLKTAMMQELLSKGIGHTEFKDSPVGKIPAAWKTDTLAHCALIKNNLRKPINKEERELMKGIFPYYGPTKAVDYINEYRIEGEHVLIGEDGDHFIKFSTWPMTQFVSGQFNVNNHAHIVQGTDVCRTKWIYYYFMHRDITVSLTRQGATRYKLNKASLEELELALPCIEEQDRINSIFDSLMIKLALREQEILKLRGIRKSLMQDLLTGKVRVKVD
ncbi:restriction endonuclease subunit S [Collimonas silvisoli]|uniref:restriction endonuclease subunit S n=1 Tax=Collimonas silvisoli TaxID=2825884 RepID=UPI001B8CBA68|nr:restriction endonuclease subunit S [Collimonas silvisoli]